MVDEIEKNERRGLMLSDRKASKVLGITVLRASSPAVDQEASEIPGATVVRSKVDWKRRVNPKKLLETKIAPSSLRKAAGAMVSEKEGQKVVLSSEWYSSRVSRRHRSLYESSPPVSEALPPPRPRRGSLNQITKASGEQEEEYGGGGLDPGAVPELASSESLGIMPLHVPSSCPPSPTDSPTPLETYREPVLPTTRSNPVLQKRREMVRSANKSVQILGVEARRAILENRERENAGRIGWCGV